MYLDSAIIVKLLVEEEDSVFFFEAIHTQAVSSSELAYAEVRAALLAKTRAKLLRPTEQKAAWEKFLRRLELEQFSLHPLESRVLRKAAHILDRCHPSVPLRTLDAIHVAACDLSQDFPLCTTDARMRAAAERLGIPVFPAN